MNPDEESIDAFYGRINKRAAGTPDPLRLWWHGDPDSNDRSFLVEGLLPEIGTAIMPGAAPQAKPADCKG
jgi:hypothetical protein